MLRFYFLVEQYLSTAPSTDAIVRNHIFRLHTLPSKHKHGSYKQLSTHRLTKMCTYIIVNMFKKHQQKHCRVHPSTPQKHKPYPPHLKKHLGGVLN